ncbi:MAG: MFS transporter [Gammaproteobacteria bacterium]
MFNRNLKILVIAQALGMSAAPFVTLLGGILGSRLAPDPRMATLPVALTIIGMAVMSVPAAMLMRRIGRRDGFMLASMVATVAAIVAAIAIQHELFWMLCFATFLMGCNGAFVLQYRFAAAETVDVEHTSRAISMVMLGAIGAAILGPEMASIAEPVAGLPAESVAFIMLAAVMMVNVLVLSRLGAIEIPRQKEHHRVPLRQLLWRMEFAIAVMAAAVAYAVMSFIMTATPISMHVMDGHSMQHTARVVQTHVVFMYLPSLFSGHLIHRLGATRTLFIGALAMLACLAIAASGRELAYYWAALVMLGIGWNLLFVGGTTLVAQNFRGNDRFTAQATNDVIVFSLNAFGSLGSGFALFTVGWGGVLAIALPPLILFMLVLGGWILTSHRATAD